MYFRFRMIHVSFRFLVFSASSEISTEILYNFTRFKFEYFETFTDLNWLVGWNLKALPLLLTRACDLCTREKINETRIQITMWKIHFALLRLVRWASAFRHVRNPCFVWKHFGKFADTCTIRVDFPRDSVSKNIMNNFECRVPNVMFEQSEWKCQRVERISIRSVTLSPRIITLI